MLTLVAKSFTENVQATNAEATDSDCRLLEFPDLPLSLIWNHARELPMHDRRALLATCKSECAQHRRRAHWPHGEAAADTGSDARA